jgi:hypothetical protein
MDEVEAISTSRNSYLNEQDPMRKIEHPIVHEEVLEL